MQKPSFGIIVPSYKALDYLQLTLHSFYRYTPDVRFVVVDDATPNWHTRWSQGLPSEVFKCHRFDTNGGLTRSWNFGFRLIKKMSNRPTYAVFANNDILATPGWWRAMVNTVEHGYALAGPLSNAPGVTAQGKQEVGRYVSDYRLTDDPVYNAKVAEALWESHGNKVIEGEVNGFFMFGRTDTFAKHMYDRDNIFSAKIPVMPSGRVNRTPLMTGQEDELQARWRKKGLKSAISLGSFIFHYRSVSRGMALAKPGWYRRDGKERTV